MSKYGSEREFIFTLYTRENKHILEQELNLTLDNDILLEKKYHGMMLDMYGRNNDTGEEVIIENVLLKSNPPHQKKVLKIINSLEQGTVIYQALDFKKEHMKELEEAVKNSEKPITLYLVKINPYTLQYLDHLNKMHKLQIYWNLNVLDEVPNPITLFQKYENMPYRRKRIKRIIKKPVYDFEKVEDVNAYLLQQLKYTIPNFLPFQREKSNLANRILTFGGGFTDVQYHVSTGSCRFGNKAFLELRFSDKYTYLYQMFKLGEQRASEKIGYEVVFKNNRIGVYFNPCENVIETINRIVNIFNRMIYVFSDFIFKLQRFEANLKVS